MPNNPKLDRDELIRSVRDLLGEKVKEEIQLDGSLSLIGGDPSEVIVRLSGNKITVSEFRVRWDGPHTPTVHPRLVTAINWKSLPDFDITCLIGMAIESTRRHRIEKYRTCLRCGETNPPEWMHGDDICQSCAERHLGVVH
ncbi:MAG TPA: hypothetical protein DD473_02660 [Planctomycetaceae bacterium]|nr:hypothetical protein [Planctomycetaceae bacterium]